MNKNPFKLIEPRQKTGCWITGLLMVALGVVVMVVYVISVYPNKF